MGNAVAEDVDKKALAQMMIGRDVLFSFSKERIPRQKKVLEVDQLIVNGDKGFPVVNGISFDVFRNLRNCRRIRQRSARADRGHHGTPKDKIGQRNR